MAWKKKVLAQMNKCYSIGKFDTKDKKGFLAATEKEGPCLLFDLDGNLLERVWEGPGGVMTINQLPNREDSFLATQKFFSPNCGAEEAEIVFCKKINDNNWEVKTLYNLPYVHRFGILKGEDGRFHIIACTIKLKCEYKEDWRFPGVTYVAELPVDNIENHLQEKAIPLKPLLENQLKNHGFYLSENLDFCLVTTDEAVLKILPPKDKDSEWTVENILQKSVSDACLVDFDGDGNLELVTLASFHGDELSVYKSQDNEMQCSYIHNEKLPFLHAIWACKIKGRGCAIIGHRKGDRTLLILSKENGEYKLDVVDKDFGPANAWAYNKEGQEFIIAANRETDELALYKLEDNMQKGN